MNFFHETFSSVFLHIINLDKKDFLKNSIKFMFFWNLKKNWLKKFINFLFQINLIDIKMLRALTFCKATQDEILVLCGVRFWKHHEEITSAQGWRWRVLVMSWRRTNSYIFVSTGIPSPSTIPSRIHGTHFCK